MSEKKDQHVTSQAVVDVLEGRTTCTEMITERLSHLSTTCKSCQHTLLLPIADRFGWVKDERANNDLLAILLVALKAGPEGLERWAQREADELLAVEAEERRELLEADPDRFRVPFLVDELLARCEEQLTQDAGRALELAELAVDISLRVDPEAFTSLAWHARARAEAHRANSLRLRDEPRAAQDAFHHAYKLYGQAKVLDPAVEAEICYLEASLAIDQRRFEKADSLLAKALAVYRRADESHDLALTLLKKAHAAYQRGRPSAGLEDLRRAAILLERSDDGQHYVMARFNLVLYATEAGDLDLARRQYQQHRKVLESRSEPWFTARLQWLRAKMAYLEEDPNVAQQLFASARETFLTEGLGFDAALASLELAMLHLETGDTDAVQRLASEMLPIFEAQDVHREALAALALFQQAAQAEELTAELVRSLRRYLQLARADPSLTFEASQATRA